MLLLLGLVIAAENIGSVALMTFSMDMPYGLEEVRGRKPDGSVVMTRGGGLPWFRAGFGRRPKLGADPTTVPPEWTGFVLTDQHTVPLGRRTALVTVGSGTLADGSPIVVFDAVVADQGIPPFVMEAILPGDNATAWVAELERSLESVELLTE